MKNILLLTNTQIFQPSTDSEHLGARVEVSVQITYYEFQVPGALLVLPAACGELFWSAAVLSALGSTLAVIIGLPLNATIIVSGRISWVISYDVTSYDEEYFNTFSAIICIIYTLFGGLYAVAYTDVAQLFFIIVGLFMAIPNIMTSDFVDTELMLKGPLDANGSRTGPEWIGTIEAKGNSWAISSHQDDPTYTRFLALSLFKLFGSQFSG